jgi:hypothetical protein
MTCLLLELFDEITLVGSGVLSLALLNTLLLEIGNRTDAFKKVLMMMIRMKPLL